jgi:hypothetical protein
VNRGEIARRHFKAYIHTIQDALQQRDRFDLLIAPYNSGAALAAIGSMVCAKQGLPFFSQTLLLPVFTPYRFTGTPGEPEPKALPYDNSRLIPALQAQYTGWPPPTRVLFIDDEIGNGTAFTSAMTLCKEVFAARGDIACTIVAEENGFRVDYSFPGVRANLIPFARRPSPEISGVLFDIVPEAIVSEFARIGVSDRKQIACTLLELPVKTLDGRTPTITHDLVRKARLLLPEFQELRRQFFRRIHDLAEEGWQELSRDSRSRP